MEPQSLPSILPADSAKGGVGPKNNWEKAWLTRIEGGKGTIVRKGSPSIKLGLGIGAAGSGGRSHVMKKVKSAFFTPRQLHELHQQALIFKYIVAGLSVPSHLVLPIWKSVSSSFGSDNGEIYKQYPSFIGFSPQGFDYRSMMDPEPGRCRRTDGKKWRCSRNVVLSDQKYCERHLHRGRNRSRKHVETSENISKSLTATINCNNTAATINSFTTANLNTNLIVSNPANLKLKIPSFKASNIVPATSTTVTISSASGNSTSNSNVDVNNDISTTPTALITCNSNNGNNDNGNVSIDTSAATANSNGGNKYNYLDGKDSGFNHIDDRNNINKSSNDGDFGRVVAPGFGFSQKSFHQGGTIVGCSTSGIDYRTGIATAPQRCKRTDGKKWQCSWDVVPEQKYCERHMHRGTKRFLVASESVVVAVAPLAPPKMLKDRINLNTDLSISIVASPQQVSKNENDSTSGSSSDATTITDETDSP